MSPTPRLFCSSFIFLFVTCLALPATLAQQPQAEPVHCRVSGTVRDQRDAPINKASITLSPLASGSAKASPTSTDYSGGYSYDNVQAGEYELRTTASGFAAQSRRVTINASQEAVTVDFVLATTSVSETVTITPARTELQLSDSASSVTVLNSQAVSNAAAQTVDDLLRQVPGFSNFRRSSSMVANPTAQGVSLRGAGASGASRTLVLNDGIPLNDAFGGWVYWDRVARTAIDRVELVRGGASDLYGSDALSGVINLITRPASQRVVSAEVGYGNRETADVSFFAAGKHNNWSAALSGEAFRTDGYFIIAPELRGAADEEAGKQNRLLTLRLGYDWNAESSVFIRGALFDEDRRNGTKLQRNDTATESLAAGTRFRTRDGSAWQLTLFANQQRFHQSFTGVAANRATETLTRLQAVPSRDAGLSFNWSKLAGEKNLLVAGVDVRGVRGSSDEIIFANNRATSYVTAGGRQRRLGVFVQDLLSLTPRWQLTVSARYDHWRDSSASSVTRTLATNAVQPRFFAPRNEDAFSPRLALLYRATERLSFRAAGYRAFRAPTLNELYRAFRVGDTLTQANETLTSERLSGGEAGINWNPLSNVNTRLTYYFTETNNPIANFTVSVTPALITRQRRNLGRTRSQGLEAEIDLRVNSDWTITTGYLFADATVRKAPQDATLIGKLIPQVPRHQFTMQAAYSRPSILTAALQLRASGRQFDDDQNRLPLTAYAVIDATMARQLSRYFEIFFAAQNLLNSRYAVGRTPIETLGMPRLVRGGVRLTF